MKKKNIDDDNIKQVRATLSDTLLHQEKLRILIDELDKNNKIITDKNRKDFFDLLGNSLLGLDFEKTCILYLPDGSIFNVFNLGCFIRKISYVEKKEVEKNFFLGLGRFDINKNNGNYNISDIWHVVKFYIYGIYPEAISMSMRISKEREQRDSSPGASVDNV